MRIDQGFDKLEAKPQETQTVKRTMNIFYARAPMEPKGKLNDADRPARSGMLLAGRFSLSMGRYVVRM